LLKTDVEVPLPGAAYVECARRIAECALDRPLKGRWIDVRLAEISGLAIGRPERVLERHAGHDVGPYGMGQVGAQTIRVGDGRQERISSAKAEGARDLPTAD